MMYNDNPGPGKVSLVTQTRCGRDKLSQKIRGRKYDYIQGHGSGYEVPWLPV